MLQRTHEIKEYAVLCCSQQNRELLDLHFFVTDFFLCVNPAAEFQIKPVTDGIGAANLAARLLALVLQNFGIISC